MVRKVSIKTVPKDQPPNSKIANVVTLQFQKMIKMIENGSELEIRQAVEQVKISLNSTKLNDNQKLFVRIIFNMAKCRLANRRLKRLIEKM